MLVFMATRCRFCVCTKPPVYRGSSSKRGNAVNRRLQALPLFKA